MLDFSEFKDKLKQSIKIVSDDLKSLRTGRASVDLVSGITVEAYGSSMKISELAAINVQDAQTLVIEPWDKNLIDSILKALKSSQLNINPIKTQDLIRLVFPPLTNETRQKMVKLLKKKQEDAKIVLRNIRNEFRKKIEKMKNEPGVSEDDIKDWLKELDEIFKQYENELEDLFKAKEDQLLKI